MSFLHILVVEGFDELTERHRHHYGKGGGGGGLSQPNIDLGGLLSAVAPIALIAAAIAAVTALITALTP